MPLPQYTNIPCESTTSQTSYGWDKGMRFFSAPQSLRFLQSNIERILLIALEVVTTVENKDQHQSNISTQNIGRATVNTEPSKIEDDRVTLAVHDLILYDNCPIYEDDDYANIFISINFLNYPLEELETPEVCQKKRPFTLYPFNFQKGNAIRNVRTICIYFH